MKKFVFNVLLLLGISLIVESCTKISTKDYAEAIVGHWEVYKIVEFNGETTMMDNVKFSLFFTFDESGTFILEEYSDGEVSAAERATYWVENKTLVLQRHGYPTNIEINKLTSNNLVLHFSDENVSDFAWIYLKRLYIGYSEAK